MTTVSDLDADLPREKPSPTRWWSALVERLPRWPADDVPADAPSWAVPAMVLMCLGAFLVCAGFARGRGGHADSAALYWTGEALLLLPVVIRTLGVRTRTSERLVLLMTLAGLQSFLTWSYSPDQFRFPDELQHLRTLLDILSTGHLFTPNAALPVSGDFPGMEVVTSAVVHLSGLSPFHAGIVVVSVAHVLVPLFVFGLVNNLTRSPRTAAIATLVYSAAPHGNYYNTLFVYGAVALPFFFLCLWAALRSRRPDKSVLWAVPPFIVVMVTHPLTLAFTIVGLVVCTVVFALAREDRGTTRRLLILTAACTVGGAVWTAIVYPGTFSYLGTPVVNLIQSVTSPEGGARRSLAGPSVVHWEELTTIGAAFLTTLLVIVGVVAIWRSSGSRVLRFWSLAAVSYPVVLAVRTVSPGTAESVTRAITFLLVFAAVPAAAALTWWWSPRSRTATRGVAVAVVAVLLLGGITAGLPAWWERIPHGFIYDGIESGLDAKVLAVGSWSGRNVAPGSRVACDISVCGDVIAQARATASTDAAAMYYGTAASLPKQLGQLSLDYVFVDRRMTTSVPPGGRFFTDTAEEPSDVPFPAGLLAKFDQTAGVDRVYDNGTIQVYAVRRAWNG